MCSAFQAGQYFSRYSVFGILLFLRTPQLNDFPFDPETLSFPFQGNLPLPDQLPVINTLPKAMAIQEVFERMEWVTQPAEPAALASHFRRRPLPGVGPKSMILQLARGDQAAPNYGSTRVVRTGDLADRVTFFRNDLAFAMNPAFPKNPHVFLSRIALFDPQVNEAACQAQEQIGVFFASNGQTLIDPDGPGPLFETPIAGPLPDDLGFIPLLPRPMDADSKPPFFGLDRFFVFLSP